VRSRDLALLGWPGYWEKLASEVLVPVLSGLGWCVCVWLIGFESSIIFFQLL
jgi:hypothetical protein